VLSVGEDFVILACVIFTQCQRVTDRQTDGRTDGLPTIAITGLAATLTPCKKAKTEYSSSWENHLRNPSQWYGASLATELDMGRVHPRVGSGRVQLCGSVWLDHPGLCKMLR